VWLSAIPVRIGVSGTGPITREHSDLGAVRNMKFREYPPDKDFDGALADSELVRDKFVGLALPQARDHVALAGA
jgi:hypothetical protein